MTDLMIVDAQASAITGWATVARLKPYYQCRCAPRASYCRWNQVFYKSHTKAKMIWPQPSTSPQPFSAAKRADSLCVQHNPPTPWFARQGPCPAGRQLPRSLVLPHLVALCFSCGSLDHLRNACPTRPPVKTLPPSFSFPAPAPASAGGVSYADAAKQALNKVDSVERDLRAEVAYLAGQVNDMKEQLAKFCARQDELLAALKLVQDKVAKQVEELDTRQESLASTVKGLSASLETLTTELDAESEMMSERYMRVNRDLAIVEADLAVVLDELWQSKDFAAALTAAQELSWAHKAKKKGVLSPEDI
ncbi:hypothetical protein BCR44DRAFT_1456289 [Catenaria anguillulae PL171]|uniref:Uncharacterized protein n=1 Tax=Catenaria anguillulae PL171 TaxID=765915 RepID=A0A1Y2GT80_9FUNG|nr:hypothetical protein BCR44DRAFT_1456289 [Catenaria anguillulae PL171]